MSQAFSHLHEVLFKDANAFLTYKMQLSIKQFPYHLFSNLNVTIQSAICKTCTGKTCHATHKEVVHRLCLP